MAEPARRQSVQALLEAARILADPGTLPGEKLRRRLRETTRLSAPNIELGLQRCLEKSATESDLSRLLQEAPRAPRAHVLLSGNVFVAALRAIALALASSTEVSVRASRRDPALAEALHELLPGAFSLRAQLDPRPGEHYFAYGADSTLRELRSTLPRGLWFHGHGSGFSAVVVDESLTPEDAREVALDTALFDQQGCLSPRVVCVVGSESQAQATAKVLAAELAALELELPRGASGPEEAAAARRERDAAAYAFELIEAGSGWLSVSADFILPPANRCLHVTFTPDPVAKLGPFAQKLTGISAKQGSRREQLARSFPSARVVGLGQLQSPPLDGPVDRRVAPAGERLG